MLTAKLQDSQQEARLLRQKLKTVQVGGQETESDDSEAASFADAHNIIADMKALMVQRSSDDGVMGAILGKRQFVSFDERENLSDNTTVYYGRHQDQDQNKCYRVYFPPPEPIEPESTAVDDTLGTTVDETSRTPTEAQSRVGSASESKMLLERTVQRIEEKARAAKDIKEAEAVTNQAFDKLKREQQQREEELKAKIVELEKYQIGMNEIDELSLSVQMLKDKLRKRDAELQKVHAEARQVTQEREALQLQLKKLKKVCPRTHNDQ